jgi:hypothetical protein
LQLAIDKELQILEFANQWYNLLFSPSEAKGIAHFLLAFFGYCLRIAKVANCLVIFFACCS